MEPSGTPETEPLPCPAVHPDTGVRCFMPDTSGHHSLGHQDRSGHLWPADGNDFLRWVGAKPLRTPAAAGRRPHPDEAVLPDGAVAEPDRSAEIARLRAQLGALTANDPNWGHAQGAFQYMSGPWPERSVQEAERSPEQARRQEAIERSVTISRMHWSAPGSHTYPVTGCAWCVESDRHYQAIAVVRSIAPENGTLPHALLFVLAVDDLLRERS